LLKSTHPADRLNWTLESSNLLGTVLLYVDFTAPVEAIRNKLVEIVKGSNLWDGNVVKLQVTDAKEGAMELRAMVSARSAADAFELRCDVREKLIEFLRTEYPTAQPHARAIEQKDLSLFRSVKPNLSADEEQRLNAAGVPRHQHVSLFRREPPVLDDDLRGRHLEALAGSHVERNAGMMLAEAAGEDARIGQVVLRDDRAEGQR